MANKSIDEIGKIHLFWVFCRDGFEDKAWKKCNSRGCSLTELADLPYILVIRNKSQAEALQNTGEWTLLSKPDDENYFLPK